MMMIVMMLIKPSSFLTILLGGNITTKNVQNIYQKIIPLLYPRRKKGSKTYSLLLSHQKTAPGIFFNCPGLQSGQSGLCTCHFSIPSRAFAAGLVWIAVVMDPVFFFNVFQSNWGIFILVQQKMTQNTTETWCLFLKNDR